MTIGCLRIKVKPSRMCFDVKRISARLFTLESVCSRGEASQVRCLQQSLQPIIEPDHAHAQTHRLQALQLRPLREGVPEEGGSTAPQRESAPGLPSARGRQQQHSSGLGQRQEGSAESAHPVLLLVNLESQSVCVLDYMWCKFVDEML